MNSPIDPRLLFLCAGIKVYEGSTNREAIHHFAEHFGTRRWEEIGFNYNRLSDYLCLSTTTAALTWAIAEVCTVLMPSAKEFILDPTGISLTTRGTYRSERYGITDRMR